MLIFVLTNISVKSILLFWAKSNNATDSGGS